MQTVLIYVQSQQRRVHDLGRALPRLAQDLPTLQALEAACDEAKIEENDYTIHSYDDILYEVSLLQETIAKRAAFVENQVCSTAKLLALYLCVTDDCENANEPDTGSTRRVRERLQAFRRGCIEYPSQ